MAEKIITQCTAGEHLRQRFADYIRSILKQRQFENVVKQDLCPIGAAFPEAAYDMFGVAYDHAVQNLGRNYPQWTLDTCIGYTEFPFGFLAFCLEKEILNLDGEPGSRAIANVAELPVQLAHRIIMSWNPMARDYYWHNMRALARKACPGVTAAAKLYLVELEKRLADKTLTYPQGVQLLGEMIKNKAVAKEDSAQMIHVVADGFPGYLESEDRVHNWNSFVLATGEATIESFNGAASSPGFSADVYAKLASLKCSSIAVELAYNDDCPIQTVTELPAYINDESTAHGVNIEPRRKVELERTLVHIRTRITLAEARAKHEQEVEPPTDKTEDPEAPTLADAIEDAEAYQRDHPDPEETVDDDAIEMLTQVLEEDMVEAHT